MSNRYCKRTNKYVIKLHKLLKYTLSLIKETVGCCFWRRAEVVYTQPHREERGLLRRRRLPPHRQQREDPAYL